MKFPVGYFPFTSHRFINYQLNRWYSLGFADFNEIQEIGKRSKRASGYLAACKDFAEKAEQEGRNREAATYWRAAEFLLSPGDVNKPLWYQHYLELFDTAFADVPHERYQVPYAGSFLWTLRLPAATPNRLGTIVAIPGFDACIEEFMGIWMYLAENGYDVIAFDGPGQGNSLRKHRVYFDHDYEKPYAAVLDYFGLDKVSALGISMGGYWVVRAAAYEPRIRQVIAMPPVYDWLAMTNRLNARLAQWFLSHRKLSNWVIRLKMQNVTLRHTVQQALFIQNKHEPADAMTWMMGMNRKHTGSDRITQDVLLIGGENDAFQPPVLLKKQQAALINAHSVEVKICTKADHADQHCQIGNVGLALDYVVSWLNRKNDLNSN